MQINDLLDKAKTRANLPSDYALAKALGVQTGIVSNWRKGKRHPSDEEAVQLATLAGLEEMQVIAAIHYECATTEKKKEFWKSYLESRGIAATLGCVALGISLIVTPEPAQANVLQLQNYDAGFFGLEDGPNIHYAYIEAYRKNSNILDCQPEMDCKPFNKSNL